MTTGLVFHNDLDGLYSALLIARSDKFDIDKVFPIDYGKDHSEIKEKCDQFIIVDYADNITEEKTLLWIDHHLKNKEEEELPECAIITESPSCLRLINQLGFEAEDLTESVIDGVDIVDSAAYSETNISPVDVVFPDVNTEIGQLLALNQMLMKNRKTNLIIELLLEDTFNPPALLYKAENSTGKKIHFQEYIDAKKELLDKFLNDEEGNYIQYFDNVPLLLTRHFAREDWKGYDRNVFYLLVKDYEFSITTFDFDGNFSFQIARNPFFNESRDKSLIDIIRDEVEDVRGHENILNFSYGSNKLEGLEKLDSIISLISKENI
jgi:regulator of RNase E activity RraB